MDNGNDLPAHVPFLENSDEEQFQQIVALLYVTVCSYMQFFSINPQYIAITKHFRSIAIAQAHLQCEVCNITRFQNLETLDKDFKYLHI